MMAYQQQLKLTFIILIFLILAICATSARPGIEEEYRQSVQAKACQNDDQKLETCQRCAKKTKSPIVYPMCCTNEEDVFNWCNEYINYGSKP